MYCLDMVALYVISLLEIKDGPSLQSMSLSLERDDEKFCADDMKAACFDLDELLSFSFTQNTAKLAENIYGTSKLIFGRLTHTRTPFVCVHRKWISMLLYGANSVRQC